MSWCYYSCVVVQRCPQKKGVAVASLRPQKMAVLVESHITPPNHDGIARCKDYNLDLPIIRLFYIHYYSIRRCPSGRREARVLEHLSPVRALRTPDYMKCLA
jgi:hypothetical protein